MLSSCELLFPSSVYEKIVENCLINPKKDINSIYVLLSGNDNYPGINKSEPVKNIKIAIERPKKYFYYYIYIQATDFFLNNGLNNPGLSITNVNNIKLIGVFDNDFSKIIGQNFLSGNYQNTISNVINNIEISKNIEIVNFKISGYSTASKTHDALGMIITNSSNILIKNYNFYSNVLTSNVTGLAIYINSSSEVHNSDSVINNYYNADIIYISSFYFSNNPNITISGEIFKNFQSSSSIRIPLIPVDSNFLHLKQNLNSTLINLYMTSTSYNSTSSLTNYISLKYETNLTIQHFTFVGFGSASKETSSYEHNNIRNHKIISNRFKNISELNNEHKKGTSEAYGNILC